MKNMINTIKNNKGVFIRRGLIVLGTAAGLVLTVGLLKVASDAAADEDDSEEILEAEIVED